MVDPVHAGLATARAEHDLDRAISACSRLLARPISRLHPAAFHNRGLALAAKGRLDEAIADIGQGIRLDPQRAYRWQERGELYSRQGKYPQALTDISEAIRIDPTRAFRFHTRGEAYRGAGDLQKAIADFSEAIRIDPVSRLFRYHDRGNVLRDSGRYDLALTDYETALKLASTATGRDPRAAWVLLDRGRANARMGRSPAARADYDAALGAEPADAELRRQVDVEVAALTSSVAATPPTQAAQPRPPEGSKTPVAPPRSKSEEETSSGSAFVVSARGHLLTKYHVVEGCDTVAIAGVGPGTIASRDVANDLALILAKPQSGFEPVKARTKPTRLGEEVVALGYPLRGVLGDGLNVTTGTISALSGIGNDSTRLQFTAPIQPGNSGGPLVDRAGAFVGVVTGKFSDTLALKVAGFVPQGVNFAIRKEIANAFLESQGIFLEPGLSMMKASFFAAAI